MEAHQVIDAAALDSVKAVLGRDRPRHALPLGAAMYALIEALGNDARRDPEVFQEILEQSMEAGLVLDAVVTVETGAKESVSCAVAGAVTFGRLMNVGNCALSMALGLADTTS